MKVRIQFYSKDSPAEERKPKDDRPCFKSIPVPRKNRLALPTEGIREFEIDPEVLFDNQFNTKEGLRLFDWYESFTDRPGGWYCGHYVLEEDWVRLQQLRDTIYVCGYCGYQTTNPEQTSYWCKNCLGSEYLSESELWMLLLLPITKTKLHSKDGIEVLESMKEAFIQVQAEYQAAQGKRLIKQRENFIKKVQERHQQLDREKECILAIYDAGLDPRKLGVVYYNHTDKLSFGAIKDLSKEEAEMIYNADPKIPCAWDVRRK